MTPTETQVLADIHREKAEQARHDKAEAELMAWLDADELTKHLARTGYALAVRPIDPMQHTGD